MKQRILFVCLGNICRSPAAHHIFESLVEEYRAEGRLVTASGEEVEFVIDSAGTYGGHAGDLPDSRMRAAGARRGYTFTHRSRKVRSDDFEDFDLILAMDDENYERLSRLAPTIEGVERVERMIDYIPDTRYTYVPDPYYEGHEGFELVLDMLEKGCRNLLDKLLAEPVGLAE
jgi:protein-tyrosine phosphatase